MTDKECVEKYFTFLRAINKQGYSQHLMEIASNMLLVVPKDSMEVAFDKFTEIAEKSLSERDYHYVISQVFKDLMGYEKPKLTPQDDRMCPLYEKVISGELCYEIALCMQGQFHISSVPEADHIKMKFEDAKLICSVCPYADMD